MNKNRFGSLADELKARKTGVPPSERPNVETSERIDESTTTRKAKGDPGKRASGWVQIAGLVPAETRDSVKVALAFEDDDLSELLTKLLNEWLESRPEHVRQAIEKKRRG